MPHGSAWSPSLAPRSSFGRQDSDHSNVRYRLFAHWTFYGRLSVEKLAEDCAPSFRMIKKVDVHTDIARIRMESTLLLLPPNLLMYPCFEYN